MKPMNLEGWNVERGFGFAKLREGGKIESVYVQLHVLCDDLRVDAIAARVAKSVLGATDGLAIAMVNAVNGRDPHRENRLTDMHRDRPVRIYGEVHETKQGLRASRVQCEACRAHAEVEARRANARSELQLIFANGFRFTIEGAEFPFFYSTKLPVRSPVIEAFESAALSAIETGKSDAAVQVAAVHRAQVVYRETQGREGSVGK